MQQKTGLIIVIAIGLLIILLALVLFFVQKPTPLPELGPAIEPSDAVEELTEGTTITDIEQDLEALKQEALFGDLEAEVQGVDEELESEGL